MKKNGNTLPFDKEEIIKVFSDGNIRRTISVHALIKYMDYMSR